jgi:hypothetical protein
VFLLSNIARTEIAIDQSESDSASRCILVGLHHAK